MFCCVVLSLIQSLNNLWHVWRGLLNLVTLLHDAWNFVVWNLKRMGCLQFFFPHCQYIYLFFNKYIALEVRFICVGHLIVLPLVYTIELSMRLTSLSKILEGIMICPHARVSACSSQALTACYHMYHANHWRSRTIDTPRVRRVRGHRIPEY